MKKQYLTLSAFLLLTGLTSVYASSSKIELPDGTWYIIFWVIEEEVSYYDSQERDIDLLDDYEEKIDAYWDLCDDLNWSKPAQCNSDPGNESTFVAAFLDSSSSANGYWYSGEPAVYRDVFEPALVSGASHFRQNGSSSDATLEFLNGALAICVNGNGANIQAPANLSVTNEAYCVTVAAEIAEGMDTNFSVPQGWAPNYYTPSIPLNLGAWGSYFYDELTDHLECDLYIAKWDDLQCDVYY